MAAYGRSMRPQGAAAHDGAIGTHRCYVYDDEQQFHSTARRFLSEGLERGDRLLCVGPLAVAAASEGPDPIVDAERLVASGALAFVSPADAYPGDVDAQIEFYDDLTRRALAEGYAGLRVVTDLAAVADPRQLVRWERRADAYVASGSGMSALCAYPRRGLPTSTLDDLATLHPESDGHWYPPAFRIYFHGNRLKVAGDLDAFGVERLRRLLDTNHLGEEAVTVDVSALAFIDGHASVVLEASLRELAQETPVQLVGASTMFRRLWGILGFSDWLPPVLEEVRA